MSKENAATSVRAYGREIAHVLATGQATEHSYRPALQTLVQGLDSGGARALNEPSHVACGAPDFIVQRREVPIGHIECKNVGANLDQVQASEQLTRYRKGLPNLVLTDYLEFRWFVDGELRETARIGHVENKDRIRKEKGGEAEAATLFHSFLTANPPSIAAPLELAEKMAAKTRLLRDSISRILKMEGRSGPLRDMLAAYRNVLIAGLSDEGFADMQAQTAAYGLFAARCLHDTSTQAFTRQSATFSNTTPFLRDVFGRIAGPGIDSRIAWIVDDLALLLARADMEAILEDLGAGAFRKDPLVHFYEDFLAAYDPELREVRGVYFTPEPVVSYIVRSIHQLLQQCFGLADGLAETSQRADQSGPAIILDPAAGTGTFLREVVIRIRETIESKGLAGAWPDYVRDYLLPRLFGLELLMAPYAICHLKLALEFGETENEFEMPPGQRLGIFLTNTLEEAHEATPGALFAHEIAREAASADHVKREKPVMVVLGNPPYSGHSANKGKWIRGLIADYKAGFPELNKPGQGKWLNDDYVKFIRFAQWRIDSTGEGVLGFVTNHKYLDNPTFRGMRRSLLESFDEIYLLDLHGNAKRKERAPDGGKDENVFDIQQGVAIGLFVKRAGSRDQLARVFHADLWGERELGADGGKYGWLESNDVRSTEWTEISPKPNSYLFVPRDETFIEEYEAAWSIPDIFSPSGRPAPGIVTTHDQFAISWSPEEAVSKVERFLDTKAESEARRLWRLCSQDQWKYERAKNELADGSWKEHIEPILYRPFDTRATIYDRNVAVHRRERVMRHMLAGPNIGLSTTKSTEISGGWEHVFVSRSLIQHHSVSLKEVNYLFPLYQYAPEFAQGEKSGRIANLAIDFIKATCTGLDLRFIPEGAGDCSETIGPEDIFCYIYAVLYSPEYRCRYADLLKSGFPRVPMTSDIALFATLARLGKQLVDLHVMDAEGKDTPAFSRVGSNRIGEVGYMAPSPGMELGRVFINRDQYFEGVTPETWNFTIGGYQPAQKWLKDRKKRVLSYKDITHYRRLCAALSTTLPIVESIDEAIEECGGWPIS